MSSSQPEGVQKIIGAKGELLSGLLTAKAPMFKGYNIIKLTTEFNISDSIDPVSDVSELYKYIANLETHYGKLLKVISTRQDITTGPWSYNWNRELRTIRRDFDNKFGKTSRDYQGECLQGFSNISIAGGYMFSVWSEYKNLLMGHGSQKIFNDMKSYVNEHLTLAKKELDKCNT